MLYSPVVVVEHHLSRYLMTSFFPIAASCEDTFDCFKRNLVIRGVLYDSDVFKDVFDKLQQFSGESQKQKDFTEWTVADLGKSLKYALDLPTPKAANAFQPDPQRLSEARDRFAKAKAYPFAHPDDGIMDGITVDQWYEFAELGKTALYVFSEN